MNDSGSQFFKSEFKYCPLVSSHEIQLSDINLGIKETRKIVDVSQGIVNKADDIVDNVKQVSAVGGIVKVVTDAFVSGFVASKKGKKTDSKKEKK